MIRVRCGETLYEAVVRSGKGSVEVVVDGVSHHLDVAATLPGSFVLRNGHVREAFHCVRDGDAIHLFFRGHVYRFEQEREGARAAHRHHQGSLEAPMPGKVIAIPAAVGQAVSRGEAVVIVESMKMENVLRAPQDGTVRSISVAVGDMVTPGAVLAEIE